MAVQNNYPQGPDEYRAELHPVEGFPLVKKWFMVGGGKPWDGKFWSWQGYASKSTVNRAIKREYEREETHYAGCPLCGRKTTELREAAGCPIDSINCLSHRRFPSKPIPIKLARVQTQNNLHTVYAVVDDPNSMGIDKSNHPVLGFAVRTLHVHIREDGTEKPVTAEDVCGLIRDIEEGVQ